MSENPRPTPDEAHASLDQITEARHAAVAATRRPAALDVAYAAAAGTAFAVGAVGDWPAFAIAMGFLLVASVAFAVFDRRFKRRRGRILDDRAIGAQAARIFPVYFIIFATGMFRPDTDWQPWYAVGVGVIVAVASLGYFRLEDRYQARRLAAGDYGRYDLL